MRKYKRIKYLRKDAKLNQAQIAEIIGISQTCYSKYETGVRDIPTSVLVKLSKYYKVSVDYILGITNTKTHI